MPHEKTEYSSGDRYKYLATIALAAASLGTARILQPSPRGVGTHLQLGLPPCPLFHLTGIPCPTCGLTTSFAYAARLDLYAAFTTQPFGLVAFILTILSIPLSLYLIHSGVSWSRLLGSRLIHFALYLFTALGLISWVYKILSML